MRRRWALGAALGLPAAARDICFRGPFTQERCCGPTGDAACWENDEEDVLMRIICCLNTPVQYDPPPPADFLAQAERVLSCRDKPSWSRFRRMISTVMVDGTIIPHDSRMLRLLTFHSYAIAWERDEAGVATYVKENKTGSVMILAGRLEECSLGYAAAMLVTLVVASHKCASIYGGKYFGGGMCMSDLERSKQLSMIKQILNDAISSYGLPTDLAVGVLASSAWPLRWLHVQHYTEVNGAIGATPWAFPLEPHYLATYGGFDPEGLVRGLHLPTWPAGSPPMAVDLLVAGTDWGAVEIASTLATVCRPLLGRVRVLLSPGDSALRRLNEGLKIDFVGTKSSLKDKYEQDTLLDYWAKRSNALVATTPRAALDLLSRFSLPMLVYLWNFQVVRSMASPAAWADLHACSVHGGQSRADEGVRGFAPCFLVVASPLLAEAVLPRAGLLLPVARPLCLYSQQSVRESPGAQAMALVVRQAAATVTAWLGYLARPDYPVAFRPFSPELASRPPAAVAAVLLPWSLAAPALAELYAAGLPLLVPSADYLAELSCAANAVGAILSGVGVSTAPPIASSAWQSHGFSRRTRCGSLKPVLACTKEWSPTGRARMIVEFSELVRWPALVTFASVAELLRGVMWLHEDQNARTALVTEMRRFAAEAREEAHRWWPKAVELLLAASTRGAQGDKGGTSSASSAPGQPGNEEAPPARRPVAPSPGSCRLPAPSPLAAATPLRARHHSTLRLFAQLSRPLRRLGLRYSLARGTLLGAVRHGGMIPHDSDIDVHVGWTSGDALPVRQKHWGDLSRRKSLLWLCQQVRAMVKRIPMGRHRFMVLCIGTDGAREAKLRYKKAMENGRLPMCPNALSVFMDPWFDADRVGIFQADPVAARLVLRSPADGLTCFPHQIDIYASSAVLEEYGPTCRCHWEGVPTRCLLRWDAYLRSLYGDGFWEPRPPAPEDAVPCPGAGAAPPPPPSGRPPGPAPRPAPPPRKATPPRKAAPSCWTEDFRPWQCCHPRFGAGGNAHCWGGGFNFKRCCNQASWEPYEVSEFYEALQRTWGRRCEGQSDIYDGDRPADWVEGLHQELVFYFLYLKAGTQSSVRRHALQFAAALDPQTPLDARVRGLLLRDARGRAIVPPQHVRVLDVGSGPLSHLGYNWPGVDVELVAADPLACEYKEMRSDLGITVPDAAAPRVAEAERLTEVFGLATFDAVHCKNSLDHSYNPVRGIVEMLRVVRPGRPVFLRHSQNEAEKNSYAGLHQWNLELRGGRLLAWRPARPGAGGEAAAAREVDVEARLVAEGLLDPGGLEARVVDRPHVEGEDRPVKADWVEAVLWRSSTE